MRAAQSLLARVARLSSHHRMQERPQSAPGQRVDHLRVEAQLGGCERAVPDRGALPHEVRLGSRQPTRAGCHGEEGAARAWERRQAAASCHTAAQPCCEAARRSGACRASRWRLPCRLQQRRRRHCPPRCECSRACSSTASLPAVGTRDAGSRMRRSPRWAFPLARPRDGMGAQKEGAQRVRCPGLTSLSTICGKTWCSTGSSRARPDATCHTEGRKGEAAVRSVVSEAANEWSSGEVERERRERESGSGWGRARQSRGKRKRWGKREGAVRRGEVGRGAAGERLSPSCSVAARGGGAAGEQPLQRDAAPRAAPSRCPRG